MLIARGVGFTALAFVGFAFAWVGLVWLAASVGPVEVVEAACVAPSWLDVVATAPAALMVGLLPSSRLRVLPVWLVSLGLPALRTFLASVLASVFNFGPGAYPIDVTASTLRMLTQEASLVVLASVVVVGLAAALAPPPSAPRAPSL